MVDVIYRKCTKCWVGKPRTLEFFYKNKRSWDWLNYICKECCKESSRVNWYIYYDKNKKEIWEKHKIYYKNNIKYKKEYRKKYYLNNKEKILQQTNERRKNMWRWKIRQTTQLFIKKHSLRPVKCSICWKEDYIYSHHVNYNKRNLIVRCCRSCHNMIHSWSIQCPEPIDLLKLI